MTLQLPVPTGPETAGAAARLPLRQLLARQALPLGVIALALPFALPYLQQMDLAAGWQAVQTLAPWQWVLAALATAISFAAVGRYDAEIHKVLGTGQPATAASRAGVTGIALSQTTGFGIVIGTLVRWKMLPGLSLPQVLGVNALVSGSFFLGWAIVTALAVLALPFDQPLAKPLAGLVLLAAACLAALALWAPRVAGRRPLPLPPLPRMAALVGWTALDLLAAATVFWLLLPQGSDIALTALLPAFLLASAAGMFGGTPAGIGPFEVTLLALCGHLPTEALVCALLGYRVIYYAVPAVIGLGSLVLAPQATPSQPRLRRPAADLTSSQTAQFLAMTGPAEHGLIHQGQHDLVPAGGSVWLAQARPQALVALFDAAGSEPPAQALTRLDQAARAEGRMAAAYKVSRRTAAAARALGWQALTTGDEAVLHPQSFTLAGAKHRQLRRKLRQAETAGVTVDTARTAQILAQIDADWQTRHGRARGFSIGRFEAAYLDHQRVFVAYQGFEPLAFASFHCKPGEWTLDVMRHRAKAQDGTMHSLIVAAVQAAAAQDVPRLSLAAVPRFTAQAGDGAGPAGHLRGLLAKAGGAQGLRQFKAAFAPRWEPQFLVAPTRLALALAAWDIARAISDPDPLPDPQLGARPQRAIQAGLTKMMKSLNLPQVAEHDRDAA